MGMLSNTQADRIPAEWDLDAIVRFWDYIGSRADLHQTYFSKQVGGGIATFLRLAGRLRPGVRILDYGCGPGYLLDHLLKRGAHCSGVDVSAVGISRVNARLAGSPGWTPAVVSAKPPAPLPEQSFDVVTCLETLEHLADGMLQAVVDDVCRLVRPGGIALFTTPYSENLATGESYCPFCRSVFHRWQHMRSIDSTTVQALIDPSEFRVLYTCGIDLGQFGRGHTHWRLTTVNDLAWGTCRALAAALDRIAPRAFPNGREFRFRAEPGANLCCMLERIGSRVAIDG
jgi:2-polyprenyl-3-methyl-5-hydroxy-6-metoxy-1,4-benzoquinol methylase